MLYLLIYIYISRVVVENYESWNQQQPCGMGSYRGPVQIRNDKSRPPSSARGHPARASKHRARCRRNSSVGEFTILPGNIDVENPAIVDHVLSLSLSLSLSLHRQGKPFFHIYVSLPEGKVGPIGQKRVEASQEPWNPSKMHVGSFSNSYPINLVCAK